MDTLLQAQKKTTNSTYHRIWKTFLRFLAERNWDSMFPSGLQFLKSASVSSFCYLKQEVGFGSSGGAFFEGSNQDQISSEVFFPQLGSAFGFESLTSSSIWSDCLILSLSSDVKNHIFDSNCFNQVSVWVLSQRAVLLHFSRQSGAQACAEFSTKVGNVVSRDLGVSPPSIFKGQVGRKMVKAWSGGLLVNLLGPD